MLSPIKRALISVSDKTGLAEFGQALVAANVEVLSTGGSAKVLRDAGVPVTEVSDFTGFPEIMDGRVKTLQPTIHGGLLAVRGNMDHEAAMEEQWEPLGHGYIQRPMHKVDNEFVDIKSAIEKINNFTKQEIIGWESPGLTETNDTLDILSDHGIKYVANWPIDDLPEDLKVKNGNRMITLPYPVEINDVVITSVQVHKSDEIFTRGKLQFDRLYQETDDNVKIMAISVHPYLTGVPHRILYFEKLLDYILEHKDVEIMTGRDIHDWYTNQVKK
mgnify:CR=1 FL=1